MADKRKGRKKREEIGEKPSKDEYAVAKYLRNNLPVKKTILLSHKVEYFTASKAVDLLLKSPWSSSKRNSETLFPNREAIVDFLDIMLNHKFFHRAKKIPVTQKELKRKKKQDKEAEDESSHAEETKEKKASKRKERDKVKDGDKGEDKKEDGKEKKKEKRKIKLNMHMEQIFVDGPDAYVWIYDPIPTKAWLIGGLLVVGAILLCLFPLWPSSVRKGVYYLSIAAASFLCVIVALVFIRIIAFCVIWLLTLGRHHLWILPNLTEDVGFLESFWPLFKYEYKGNASKSETSDKVKKKKLKDSDDEKANENVGKDSENEKEKCEKESDPDPCPTDTDRDSEESGDQQQKQDNEFEMIHPEELENSDNTVHKRTKSSSS